MESWRLWSGDLFDWQFVGAGLLGSPPYEFLECPSETFPVRFSDRVPPAWPSDPNPTLREQPLDHLSNESNRETSGPPGLDSIPQNQGVEAMMAS